MPTYEDLREYFEKSEALRAIVKETSDVRIVRGYTLDVDPFWSLAYDIEDGIADPSLAGLLEWLATRDFPTLYEFARRAPSYQGYRRRDLYRSVPAWDRYNKNAKQKRSPVVMTVVHRPLRAPTEKDDTDRDALRRLFSIAAKASVAIRIEERPPARLALAGGDKILTGGGKSGTLGGVLTDSHSGDLYGVTCAHVAQKHDKISDSAGTPLGTCTADTARTTLPSAKVCDPVNLAMPSPSPGNGPDVNMLDCALIKLTTSTFHQPIGAVAPALTQGQDVVMHGAATGTTWHKLGSLCLSYQFTESGHDYCFRDAIELLPQPRGPLGGAIGSLFATVPTQGDSGGWILTDDTPADWAAVFFGEDGHRGFAIRASWVHNWAQQATGRTLTV